MCFSSEKIQAIKYRKQCLNNPLKNQFFLSSFERPNISIIIPLYNCQSSIKKVIESIQCQNFFYYEIILVDDFSIDNTSFIIDSLQKIDKRIIIIKNKKNMGILYSRCIAALNTKGDYIFPLDNDDLIFNPNILHILYNKAIKNNYDIIGFNSFNIHSYNFNIS
jgi:glycosyltransferase involved in cell wall biosynthesis